MKDFRKSPYSNERKNPGALDSPSDGKGFIKFAFVASAIILAVYFLYPNGSGSEIEQKEPETEEKVVDDKHPSEEPFSILAFLASPEEKLEEYLEKFFSELEKELEEKNSTDKESDVGVPSVPGLNTDSKDLTSSDPSLQEEETESNRYSITEHYVIPLPKGKHLVNGLIKNENSFTAGSVKITAKYNGSQEKITYIFSSFIKPGDLSAFQVRLDDWDGESPIELSAKMEKHYDQDIPDIRYKIPQGTWQKSNISITYQSKFQYLSEHSVRFVKLIVLMRDRENKIYDIKFTFVVKKEEDYIMPPKSVRDFKITEFKKQVPAKTDFLVSYMPLAKY